MSETLPRKYATLPEAVLNLYNWPSEKGETWRHISHFEFFNAKEKFTSLEVYEGSKGYVLKGCLLPPPTKNNAPSAIVERWVSINISHFSIDFGDDNEDPSRGFWLTDFENAWYKLEEPTLEYAEIANVSKVRCQKFLEFFDVVVHMEVDEDEYYSMYDDDTETYSCELTLTELHKSCSAAFDIKYLERNACFYYEQLHNQFSLDCPLMLDLKMKNNAQRRDEQTARLEKHNATAKAMRNNLLDCDSDEEEGDGVDEEAEEEEEIPPDNEDSDSEEDVLVDSDEDESKDSKKRQRGVVRPPFSSDSKVSLAKSEVKGKKRRRVEESMNKEKRRLHRNSQTTQCGKANGKFVQHRGQNLSSGGVNTISELSLAVQAAGDRARARDQASSSTLLLPSRPMKQGTGLKPDYLLVQQHAKEKRISNQKHHLPLSLKPLGVDRHDPRSHIR